MLCDFILCLISFDLVYFTGPADGHPGTLDYNSNIINLKPGTCFIFTYRLFNVKFYLLIR